MKAIADLDLCQAHQMCQVRYCPAMALAIEEENG